MPIVTATDWDQYLEAHPEAHLLQSRAWGELKAAFGWQPFYVLSGQSGAQILFRKLASGVSLAYLPKGPVGRSWQLLWPEMDRLCRQQGAVFVKVEPDRWELESEELAALQQGFVAGADPIQPRRTVVIDLEGDEETWLGRMKQKTRYNIHLAERKGVVVQPSQDVEGFYRLMQATGTRDSFGVHHIDYYRRAYRLFAERGQCALLMASYEGQPLAGLMVFAQGPRAWYFYGGSNDLERNRMPAYLLQWQAMRWAAAQGCTLYDLWGVPDADEPELEENFTRRADGLWGVYRFKRGFGGRLMRSVGAWDRVYRPGLYQLYRWWSARRGGEHE